MFACMPVSPQIEQHPTEVVSLDDWQLDEEFPYGPQGAKPKRIFVCPNPPPHRFLIGGHRYLFKEPGGSRAQQIWSEVIAYELSRDLRLTVPPAFLAEGPGNGSPGVLIEFFYGYKFENEKRFEHAIEHLQARGFPIDFRRGSLKDNITLCRMHAVPEWRSWWARTLAFDAVIGNVDRHTENWGFLIEPEASKPIFTLAPAFDNGTSLGYIVREAIFTATCSLRASSISLREAGIILDGSREMKLAHNMRGSVASTGTMCPISTVRWTTPLR
jgi:hypothetical protein